MRFPLRSAGDPGLERFDFLSGERMLLTMLRGRHLLVGVDAAHAHDHLAGIRLAGNQGAVAALELLHRRLARDQRKTALRLVQAVALQTVLREDGSNVAVEIRRGGREG